MYRVDYNKSMESETKPDFTATSLAKAAGVHKTYVARLCKAGIIPAVKIAGAVWVIRYEDGAAWLAARKAKQTPVTQA